MFSFFPDLHCFVCIMAANSKFGHGHSCGSSVERHPVPDLVKEWRPKTQAGRLTKTGLFTDYASVRKSRLGLKEPEIADYFFGTDLIVAPLKTVPIGDGQYRFKAFVAVGDSKAYIGLGQSCGKDRRSAEERASKNAKLNMINVNRTWLRPVIGEYGDVTVRLFAHHQLIARPMIRKVLTTAGVVCCKAETNKEKDSPNVVLALFDALSKLEIMS